MATIKIKRGGGTPSGLTFGEPAYDTTNSKLFVGLTSGSVWVGAEVDNGDLTTNSQIKIPTQYAVKQYVDGFVGGGAVTTLNGLTGAVFVDAGTGLSVASAGKGITFTNTGVLSVAGTSNQVLVDGSVAADTGAVTLSLPSTLIAPGSLTVTTNLTVSGDLTVNGTTTTVNSNVTTVDDPMMLIGTSGGVPISASDGGKDRGIAFTYYDGTGYTGFFGHDASVTKFTYIPNATIDGDIVTAGTPGEAQFKTLFLTTDGTNLGGLTLATLSGSHNYVLPDHTGSVVVPSDLGTSGYVLKANGATTQPTWIAQSSLAAGTAATLATPRTIGITGDIDGTATSFDGSANIYINATIAANSIALGTDTTGNYAQDVSVSGIGLSITGSPGEGTQYTITSGATSNNVSSQIVARDASGNFSAGTITGSLSGNASTATTLQTIRNINLGGDLSGGATFDGAQDITITATIANNSVALGTDTTGNYVATITTSETGLNIQNSGTETAAVTIDFATITSGLDVGTFSFATDEFVNTSGTVSLGVVDGGSY